MKTEKNIIVINIAIKIILIFIIIIVNYLLQKNISLNIPENTAFAIIGGADGPTTIYIALKYGLLNVLIYLLSLFILAGIIILLVYDIVSIKNAKRYGIKNKLKTILFIYLFFIISIVIQIGFYLLGSMISIVLNVVLVTILFIKIFNKKIIKQEIE